MLLASISPEVFLARVDVAIRHRRAFVALASDDVVEVPGLRIDVVGRRVDLWGTCIDVPRNEFHLLVLLARKVGTLLPTEELVAEIWPGEPVAGAARLRVCATRLRNRLAWYPTAPAIVAERGRGYAMVPRSLAR